jgi:hypothetical protein
MKQIEIKNNRSYYTTCTHYFRSSTKWIKSMRIANYILSMAFPGFRFSHCETMFPNYNSQFIVIKKLGINIVAEKSTIHENRIYFSFFI